MRAKSDGFPEATGQGHRVEPDRPQILIVDGQSDISELFRICQAGYSGAILPWPCLDKLTEFAAGDALAVMIIQSYGQVAVAGGNTAFAAVCLDSLWRAGRFREWANLADPYRDALISRSLTVLA